MKVGDYVRTKKRGFQEPQIAKITDIKKDSGYKNQYYMTLDHNLIPDYEFLIYKEDIKKSSPNIIDLIKAGDYVNGRMVFQVGYNFQDDFVLKMSKSKYEDFIYEEDIKSIVTKEQFESIEYKLGE